MASIIPDKNLSIIDGAIEPWSGKGKDYYLQALKGLADYNNMSLTTPWNKLKKSEIEQILYGTGENKIIINYKNKNENIDINKPFIGVIPSLNKRLMESHDPWYREELSKYQSNRYGWINIRN